MTRSRSIPDWEATLEALQECLESTLIGINLGKQEGLRPDVTALDALTTLDEFLVALKRDLGV